MSFPTPSDYQEAVQDPASAFADPELQSATPRENVLGLPQPITGAFAAVFPMTTDAGIRYAVKCFLSDVPHQQRRYASISEALEELDLPWTVDFTYQPEGILVHGERYPALKMQWAEGLGLNRFVAEHLDEPASIRAVAQAWADLCADLEAAGIAHGDFQHGNIRVDLDRDPPLRLVDYDTMYVPALDGASSAEMGHRNYQPPDRTDRDFHAFLDRFSALAIYTALQACAEHPNLWATYDNGENLLFRDQDYYAPSASPLFRELKTSDALGPLAAALERACLVEPESIPALGDLLEEGDTSTWGGIETRSRDNRRARRSTSRRRTPFETWAGPAVMAGLVAVLAVGASWSLGTGAVLGILGAALASGISFARYQRLPSVRRERRLSREVTRITQAVANLERQVNALQEKRADVLDSIDEQRAQRLEELREEALYDHLKHHFVGEVREVEGLTHKHVVRLKSANLRTAYEATPERVAEIRRLSDEARARLAMWRASLVREAEDDLPDSLSPAEERRLRRYVQHRVEDIDDEIQRAREKIEVQSTERDEIRERWDAMALVGWTQYILYLFYLTALPPRDGQTRPDPRSGDQTPDAPPPSGTPAAGSHPAGDEASSLPDPTSSDAPWWVQT